MKRYLFLIFIFPTLLIISWCFLTFWTGKWYNEYLSWWEYRRLHPELIPSPIVVKAFDMGHTSSYSSFVWLELIQYIGDNVWGNRFLNFSHTLLEHITILHPYFSKPYELDLILTPLSVGENMDPTIVEYNKNYTQKAISLGKKWMSILCDAWKIEKIKQQNISESLWKDQSLRNPCSDGMLPYYIAFATYKMWNNKSEASEYYKIAAMQDDGPIASRILAVIALAADGDFQSSAMTFLLLGSSGYDIEPYNCKNYTNKLIKDLINKRKIDSLWIEELQKDEPTILKDTRNDAIPESKLSDNCYDMTTRGIREIYLSYISELAKWTSAKNEKDLIDLWILKKIPTLSTQSGYTVRQIDGIWAFREN